MTAREEAEKKIRQSLEERDKIIADCVKVLSFIHTHSLAGLVLGGEGPAVGFLDDIKVKSSVLLQTLKDKGYL